MTYTTAVNSFSNYAQAYAVAEAKRAAFYEAREQREVDLAAALLEWRATNWDAALGTNRQTDVGLQVDFFM